MDVRAVQYKLQRSATFASKKQTAFLNYYPAYEIGCNSLGHLCFFWFVFLFLSLSLSLCEPWCLELGT